MVDPNLKAEFCKLFDEQEGNLERASSALKVMAHPARMKVLCVLRTGEHTVQDIEEYTGLLQTTLSQHLSLLKSREIVTSRKEGTYSFYRMANQPMIQLFDLIKQIYCS